MNLKSVVQIVLLLLILAIFYSFYFIYFKKDVSKLNMTVENQVNNNEIKLIKEDESKNLDNQNDSNIIKNIEYKSLDRKGNEYTLKASIGEIDIKNKNIIKLNEVTGKIMLIGKEPIDIYSNFAIYNTKNYDTKFFDDVKIKFENNSIYSNNFDLFIRNDVAKIYNDVSFNSNLSKIKADIVNIDLLSGNINVDMFDKSNKVKLLKK